MQTQTSKGERVQIRLNPSSKRKLEQAASYTHKSINQFVLVNALSAAEKVIEENAYIALSHKDWESFLDSLEHPPEPNKKLKQAFKRFQEKS